MKLITSFFAFLLLSTSIMAKGIEPIKLVLSTAGPSELVLKVDEPLQSETKLTIEDINGYVLYQDLLLKDEVVAKQFKLDELPNGKYRIVLSDDIFDVSYPFVVTKRGITVDMNAKVRTYKPILTVKGRAAQLNYMNPHKKPVVVKIIDQSGEIVFTDRLVGQDVITKTYDLSRLKRRNYRMVVTSGQKSVTKNLAL
ncbi:MAG: hypothetical protein AAF828_10480 [Bacteroidota bacterium]